MVIKKIFYLGVEGGATTSTAALANEKGGIIKRRIGKSLNYQATGIGRTKTNLKNLLKPLLSITGGNNLRAVFGLAGLNIKKDKPSYLKIIKQILPRNSKVEAVNDAEIALETKCPNEKNRILVISGTGANVYGASSKKYARSIGWDFVLGDEGSSYEVGLKAMKAAMKSWDGRTKKTILEKLVLSKTRTKNMEDFQSKVYLVQRENPLNLKYFIASFSPVVDMALLKKDWAARKIRNETAKELSLGIYAVAKRLGLKNKKFCLGFMGSGWKMPRLKEIVKKNVKKGFPKANFSKNQENTGVYGALSMAKRLR